MSTDSLARLRQGLHKHFGRGAAAFVDPDLWLVGYVTVDVLRLDDWLHQRHPGYRNDESMSHFIRRRYGEKAERFIAYWLKGERR